MTYKEAAQAALDVQNAVNLSGVVFTFAEAMQAICDTDQRHNMSTTWKNEHPIVTLFLEKLADLNGHRLETTTEQYTRVLQQVREIANA